MAPIRWQQLWPESFYLQLHIDWQLINCQKIILQIILKSNYSFSHFRNAKYVQVQLQQND